MGKSSLGPGFRFKPTDVELLQYYLKRKIMGRKLHSKVIAELDIYKYEPWDLPDKSSCDSGDLKWYFFCPREKKYSNGNRIKRATEGGYWKTTGKDRSVVYCGQVSGWIKTLVFHTGKPPRGDRTDWVMHEYRLENQALADKGVPLDSYVLCMFFQKEGLGPRNGAQYGVPFKEEDWSDDEVEISSEAVQESNIAEPDLRLPCNYNNSIATNMHSPEDIGTYPSSGSCIFDILPLSIMVPKPDSSNYLSQKKPHTFDVNDIQSMEENTFFTNENGKSKYICLDAVPNANMPEPDLILPNDYAIRTHISECIGASPPELSTSVVVQPPCNFLQLDTGSYVTTEKPHDSHGDDILMMLNCFTEKSAFRMPEVDNNEVGWFESFPNRNMPEPNPALANNCDNFIAACGRSQEAMDLGPSFEAWRFDGLPPSFDTSDVCENLADSGNLTSFGEVGNLSGGPDDYLRDFLELGDLDQPQHPSLFF